MGIALDGLSSGFPTTDMIKATMAVERLPQQALQTRVAASKTLTTALQDLNSKIANATTSAAAFAKPGALNVFTAVSTSAKVTAAASTQAAAGEIDLVVDKLASKHSAVTASMSEWPESPAALTLTVGGKPVTVTAASNSLDDVAAAVNGANTGVTATKVKAGDGTFRLQFTSEKTGAEAVFDVAGADGTSVFSAPGAAVIRQGQDASITLFAGTDAEQVVTSASNTFEDLLPGVAVTVAEVSATPVSISISRDDAAATKKAGDLVSGLNAVFGFVQLKSTVATTTDADGKTKAVGGVFASDSAVRSISQNLINAATYPVDGRSPSEIGIEITKGGLITFNEEKFKAALAKDPAGTEAMFAKISERVEKSGIQASDKHAGQITSRITSQESQVRNFNDQITNWDTRLAKREASLKAMYAAMEVNLSKLNSQMSAITASMNALSGSAKDD